MDELLEVRASTRWAAVKAILDRVTEDQPREGGVIQQCLKPESGCGRNCGENCRKCHFTFYHPPGSA